MVDQPPAPKGEHESNTEPGYFEGVWHDLPFL